ncbi:MAG: (Fe-S)-binding protein [Verrucomicrobiales bacterium]|nr:(Fe-S)-binding protein [Verrucomicrobiales bacterium]
MKLTLFVPCFVDALYPQVAVATVRILEQLGHQVEVAEDLNCCGQPAFNSGCWLEARPVAVRVLEKLRDAETVLIPSGSCGAMLRRFYPELLAGTPHEAAAQALAPRVFEFAEFLVEKLGVTDVGARFPHKVTYHDGCHSLREMHIHRAPRQLLAGVRDLELIEMKQVVCCGFGGTFSAKFPMISTAMGEVKCTEALATGAEYIVSCDSSCLMHVQGLIDRQKLPLKTVHLAEVLVAA